MSEEHLSEARRRLMDFAVRAVAAARNASAATSASAAKAAVTANAAATATARRATVADGTDLTDERDETIGRLEQELEAERNRSEKLARAVKGFEFKIGILERSYGKQLADARAAGEAARQELAGLETLLADTTQELKRVTAIKDRLRDMWSFDGRRVPPELRDEQPGGEDTIARLLAIANAMPDRGPSAHASAETRPHVEPEHGDLLSPELVFDTSDERDEDNDDDHAGPTTTPG